MDLSPFVNRVRYYLFKPAGLIFLFIGIVLIAGSVLLFTSIGNRLMKPLLSSIIEEMIESPVTINRFILTTHNYSLHLVDSHHNSLALDGNYSFGEMKTQGTYILHAPQGNGINPLPLPLSIKGSLNGGYAHLDLDGVLATLGMNARYTLGFVRLSPDTLQFVFHDLQLSALLHAMDYPSESLSLLHGQADLSGLAKRNIHGNIRLWNSTASFTPLPIQEEESNISLDLYDWLADEDGYVKPFTIDCTTAITLDQIGVIDQLIGYPLRGAVSLKNRIHGNQKNLDFDFETSFARSDSRFTLSYKDLLPHHFIYTLSHADAGAIFHFLNMPPPIHGIVDSQGSFGPKTGHFNLSIQDAQTRPDILKRDYHITQPSLRFRANINANVLAKDIHYTADFHSNLGRMQIDNTTTHTHMLAELLKTIH